MDTATEIQQREAQRQQNPNQNEPDTDVDVDDDADSSSSSIPVPSISRTHLLIIGAIVAAVVVWKLSQSDGGKPSQSLKDAKDEIQDETVVEANPDNVDQPRIPIPKDPNNPLAADQAVIEGLRESGKLEDPNQ